MLRSRILLDTVLFVAFLYGAMAQSQQYPQPQIERSKLGKNNSHAQPTPTVNFPTSQEITDAIAAGIERANNKRETEPPPDYSWFNVFLVVFNGLLVVVGGVNCYLIFWTLKATKIAADAAKKSAEVGEKSLIAANRPAIAIAPLKLCEPNESQTTPYINFGLVNSGKGTAIINNVTAIVYSEYGGIGLATNAPINSLFVPSDINSEIEPGQPMSGCPITAPFLGAQELQQIRSGGRTLRVTFHIAFRGISDNGYTPTISFDFDHKQDIFVTRSRLIPKE